MVTKVIFLPWPASDVASEIGEASTWEAHSKRYKTTCYTGNPIALVKGLCFLDEIYIVGHGAPGNPNIDSDSGLSLSYDEVANRLVTSGLSKLYGGEIKIWACNSGVADDHNLSFAKKFARYMFKNKGYYFCKVFGYVGKLDAEYGNISYDKFGNEIVHKHAHKFSEVAGKGEKRASSRRKRFFGCI